MPKIIIFIIGLGLLATVVTLLIPLMEDFINPTTGIMASIPDVADWELGMWVMWPIVMGLIFLGWLIKKYIRSDDQQ